MKNRDKIISVGSTLIIAACVMIFCSFTPDPDMGIWPADNRIRELSNEERAAYIENWRNGDKIWSIRDNASEKLINPALINAIQFVRDTTALVAESEMEEEIFRPRLTPLLTQDGATSPRLFAAQPYSHGDLLDASGHPLRWRMSDNLLTGYSVFKPHEPEPAPVITASLPKLPRLAPSQRASHYRGLVESFARRFNLSVELVMAIIHSESDFTPTLVSNKSAMGLMQLLPSTASDEVHRFLYGTRGRLSYAELSIPETNIRYGTAYLHILANRYFGGIKNSEIKESCIIASYNMGPNRFVRMYGRTPEQAAQVINNMGVEEFYADLQNRLPARETRFFVRKVRQMKKHYAAMQ